MKAATWAQLQTMIGGMGRALRRNIADALTLAKEAKETATEAKAKADRAQKQFSLVLGDDSSITVAKFNEMWAMTEAELQGAITVFMNDRSHAVTGLYKFGPGEGSGVTNPSRYIEMMVGDAFGSELLECGATICGLYYTKAIYNGQELEFAGWNSSGRSIRVNYDTSGNIIPAMAPEEGIKYRNDLTVANGKNYAVTPENLDTAIKYGLIDNRLTLTEAEQKAAQEWLGLGLTSPNGTRYKLTVTDDGTLEAVQESGE